jgi:hypothetical protein
MPKGKRGTGPHAGKGIQHKRVTYNAHYARYSKAKHPGSAKKPK